MKIAVAKIRTPLIKTPGYEAGNFTHSISSSLEGRERIFAIM